MGAYSSLNTFIDGVAQIAHHSECPKHPVRLLITATCFRGGLGVLSWRIRVQPHIGRRIVRFECCPSACSTLRRQGREGGPSHWVLPSISSGASCTSLGATSPSSASLSWASGLRALSGDSRVTTHPTTHAGRRAAPVPNGGNP